MADGFDDVLAYCGLIASAIAHLYVYVCEWTELCGDGNGIGQSAVFPVFVFGAGESERVGSNIFIVAPCFHIQYFSELLDTKGAVRDRGKLYALAMVFVHKVFFGKYFYSRLL